MEISSYKPGTPSWVDIGVPDMDAAVAFLISLRPAGQLPAGAVEDAPVAGKTPQPVELTE